MQKLKQLFRWKGLCILACVLPAATVVAFAGAGWELAELASLALYLVCPISMLLMMRRGGCRGERASAEGAQQAPRVETEGARVIPDLTARNANSGANQ